MSALLYTPRSRHLASMSCILPHWTTQDFFKNTSAYGQGKAGISVSPPLAGVQANLWDAPPLSSTIGSGVGSVTAGLVDCGLGFEQCTGAKVGNTQQDK
jgi:hypothetical protein